MRKVKSIGNGGAFDPRGHHAGRVDRASFTPIGGIGTVFRKALITTVLAGTFVGCGVGLIGDHADDSVSPDDVDGPRPFVAAPAQLRRLTVTEYQNSLRLLFGSDIVVPTDLEGDTIINGLEAIGAGSTTLSANAVEKLEIAALDVAGQAVSSTRRARLGVCTPQNAGDAACWTSLTIKLGRKIFRRPLESDEVDRFAAIGPSATNALSGDVWQGVAFIISALLESPSFLFRVELAEPDPDRPTRGRYDSYAMATRLSYFLTHAPPDDTLSALADADELTNPATVKQQAARLIASTGRDIAIDDFFRDWLRLERLDDLTKNRDLFPSTSTELGPAMREDILRSIAAIVGNGSGDYRDLFTSDVAFASAALAPVYGVTVTGDARQIQVPAQQGRKGLLGKPGFLALYATSERSSPTLRGKYVREAILCEAVAAPPPDVETIVPEPNPNAPTMRDRLAEHRTNPTCAACHSMMDPIGLALESFDGIGSYRVSDNGASLDLSGNIEDTAFNGLAGLADVLVEDGRTTNCAARTMYRYATGHVESRNEEATILAIDAEFAAGNYTIKALMEAIASSDGFRYASLAEGQ